MKRLVFIVEGDTEVLFVDKVIIPYLHTMGFYNPMHCQTIITNRKQHKKGGIGSYGKFTNEVKRTLAQGNVIVTTLIDFYGLPSDFPKFSHDASQIPFIENAIRQDFDNNNLFIPYIQKHELETLIFAHYEALELVIDSDQRYDLIKEIVSQFPNPEDINNSKETAPSKRLKFIFEYDKVADGNILFDLIEMTVILGKCPNFKNWIDLIISALNRNVYT